jgi:hypothetical protein
MAAMTATSAFLRWRRPSWLGLIIAAAFLAVVSVALGWELRGREARRVRSVVDAAAAALTAPAGEPDMQRLVRVAGLRKLLAEDVVIETEPGGPAIHGREAVAGLAAQLSGIGGVQAVALSDVEIAFDDDAKTRATVSALVHVTTAGTSQAPPYDGEAVRIDVRQVDGTWVIGGAARQPALAR